MSFSAIGTRVYTDAYLKKNGQELRQRTGIVPLVELAMQHDTLFDLLDRLFKRKTFGNTKCFKPENGAAK